MTPYQGRNTHKQPRKRFLIVISAFAAAVAIVVVGYNLKEGMEPKRTFDALGKQTVSVFFPAQTRLIEKKYDVRSNISDKEKAEMIINKLKQEKHLSHGFRLHEYATDAEGVMYLNVSADIIDERPDTAKEILTVYSLTNSFLANFNETRRVQLLVNGQVPYTLRGTLYAYKPIEFNKELLED